MRSDASRTLHLRSLGPALGTAAKVLIIAAMARARDHPQASTLEIIVNKNDDVLPVVAMSSFIVRVDASSGRDVLLKVVLVPVRVSSAMPAKRNYCM